MKQRLPALVLFFLAAFLIFWRINDRYVTFTDELLFEEASFEFANADGVGDWIVPSLNKHAWLEKPPLYFWLTALIFKITNWFHPILSLGEVVMDRGEFIYPWGRRFWTVIAGVVIAMLTYSIGARHLSRRHGLMAGILLLCMPLFLSTTKAASLDMLSVMWMTGAMAFYLKTKTPNSHKSLVSFILIGLFTGLAVLTRSWLGLTPLLVISLDILVTSSRRTPAIVLSNLRRSMGRVSPNAGKNLKTFSLLPIMDPAVQRDDETQAAFKSLMTIFFAAFLIAAPWHFQMWRWYGNNFLQTYLSFNLIDHAINLTPGYESTSWWFYVITLIQAVPWLLPLLIAAVLYILYEKNVKRQLNVIPASPAKLQRSKAKAGIHGSIKERLGFKGQLQLIIRSMDSRLRGNDKISPSFLKRGQGELMGNDTLRILLLWFLIPFLILTLARTRHEWYLIQVLPPLALLSSILVWRTYQAIQACQQCKMVKYLAEIAFFTFLSAGVLAVMTAPDPSAPTIKAVRWARENLPADQPLYSYKHAYLPQTLLFHPQEVKVALTENDLPTAGSYYLYIQDFDKETLSLSLLSVAKALQSFEGGSIYQVE